MFAATQPSGNSFLPRDFFERETLSVARELVGCRLVRTIGDTEIVATIVEVEAYLGAADPASHAFRGPTARNKVMFGEPGHLYVYLSYGMHHCANIVTEQRGVAGAVLLRGAQVNAGIEVVRANRATMLGDHHLLRGPGNLAKGLGIILKEYGLDLCHPDSALYLRPPAPNQEVRLQSGPRIGISKAVDEPLRFWWPGHASVSAPARGTR